MSRIIIVGAGGIGRACGLMLLKHYGTDHTVVLADIDQGQCDFSRNWTENGLGQQISALETILIEDVSLHEWDPEGDVILDCSPGANCAAVARVAMRNGMHYANLTENVPETKKIMAMARETANGFILQTGLAPGYINVFSNRLIRQFKKSNPDVSIEDVKMRVGALSIYASSPSYYAFTWSPVGVSTEYLNDAEVLREGKVQLVESLSEREQLLIEGELLEADLTSGGASDLPSFYQGKIDNLDYKSLRYPNHFSWIQRIKDNLGEALNIESLKREMLKEASFQEEDRVLLYASVSGHTKEGFKLERASHLEVRAVKVEGILMSAIQRTTASALAQCAVMLLEGRIRGLTLQSGVPTDEFLSGHFVAAHYGSV